MMNAYLHLKAPLVETVNLAHRMSVMPLKGVHIYRSIQRASMRIHVLLISVLKTKAVFIPWIQPSAMMDKIVP